MRAAFYSLGCKLNQSESEALASTFRSRGFFVVTSSADAEIYIVNSCTVTSMAEQKARRMIRKFSSQHPDSVVIVTGCYAQMDPEEIDALGDNVVVSGMDGKSRLVDLPDFLFHQESSNVPLVQQIRNFFALSFSVDDTDRFRFNALQYSYHSRAFVKIQDGCDNRCSYCRVSLARGKAVSLLLDECVDRVKNVFEAGYREVVLTGVNISAWKKVDGSGSLADLILAVAEVAKPYQARIRLSSLEPDRLDGQLIQALLHPNVAPHFHLPLQSMSQSVLTRMNRHYRIEEVLQWIEKLRTSRKNVFFAADIITGFDGESEAEFEQGFSLMKKLDFAHLHVFPFSPREGTASEKPKHPVPERIRDQRAALYRQLSAESFSRYQKSACGQEADLLVESIKEIEVVGGAESGHQISGITGNYLRPLLSLSQTQMQAAGIIKKGIYRVVMDMDGDSLIAKLV